MGVGSLSMIVPMYNAEIAPPEVRGALVGLQQLSITLGIMISFWIDYGTVSLVLDVACSKKPNQVDRTSWVEPVAVSTTLPGFFRSAYNSSLLFYSVSACSLCPSLRAGSFTMIANQKHEAFSPASEIYRKTTNSSS
jgi:hypothetical protein